MDAPSSTRVCFNQDKDQLLGGKTPGDTRSTCQVPPSNLSQTLVFKPQL